MKITQSKIKIIKGLGNITYWLMLFFVIFIGLLTLLSTTSVLNGLQIFAVSSGSMEPSIQTGSIVVVFPSENYQPGDVITYSPQRENTQLSTTHRIYEIEEADEATFYRTKGDANTTPDADLTNKQAVIGKVLFHIPYLGYLVSFTRTVHGVILLIIIPSVLIIYDELLKIKSEIKALFKKHYEKNIH